MAEWRQRFDKSNYADRMSSHWPTQYNLSPSGIVRRLGGGERLSLQNECDFPIQDFCLFRTADSST